MSEPRHDLVDLSDMSRSYPFLWLSRKFNIPYSIVLQLADGFDGGFIEPPADPQPFTAALYATCKAPWRWLYPPKEINGVQVRWL